MSSEVNTSFPCRQYKWSQKFLRAKENLIQEQGAARKLLEEERRKYRPKAVDFESVSNFIDKEITIVPVPYNKSGTALRNNACMHCDKDILSSSDDYLWTGCALCPAIIHNNCISHFDAQRNDTQQHDCFDKSSNNSDAEWWCCPDCSSEVEESQKHERNRLKADRRRRLEFLCSRKLQASIMRSKQQNRFNVLRNGMLRLQARARGVAERSRFMFELTTNHRSFRIKACDYHLPDGADIDSKSNISCTICIINDEDEDLDDCETQMYRFDTTQGLPQNNSNGRWNDSFMVYSCNCLVLFSFTLHSDRLFLGQSVFDAGAHLKKAYFTGKPYKYKVPLGPLEIDPREQGSKLPFRMEKGENELTMGKITFEVQPVSNVHSKCGVLEEILSALLKGATKKWYAVLADKTLFLFSQFGDSRPKATIPLHAGTKVEWHDRTVIKISSFDNLDQNWFFTCPNVQQRTSWYNKLTGKLSKILDEGAKQYRIIERQSLRNRQTEEQM
mmetsp:Transcript_34459/g.50532  ORF Transcript_34459/g.50532 Transcript_34459/m.50532 type:complete len:501 (-) Transcript_34459:461-1963(-)